MGQYKQRSRILKIKCFLVALAILVMGSTLLLITLVNRRKELIILSTRAECENFTRFFGRYPLEEHKDDLEPVALTVRPMIERIDAITEQIYSNLTHSEANRDLFAVSVQYDPLIEEHKKQLIQQLEDWYDARTSARIGRWRGGRLLLTYKSESRYTPLHVKEIVTLVLSNFEDNTLIKWGFGDDTGSLVGSETKASLWSFWALLVIGCFPLLYWKYKASKIFEEYRQHQKEARIRARRIEDFEASLSTFRSRIIAAERQLRKLQSDQSYRDVLAMSSEIFGSLLERLQFQSVKKKSEVISEANELISAIQNSFDISNPKSKNTAEYINTLATNILHKYQ